jgi:hypothetical protein
MADYCGNHKKDVGTLCGQNSNSLTGKPSVPLSNHFLKCKRKP